MDAKVSYEVFKMDSQTKLLHLPIDFLRKIVLLIRFLHLIQILNLVVFEYESETICLTY